MHKNMSPLIMLNLFFISQSEIQDVAEELYDVEVREYIYLAHI